MENPELYKSLKQLTTEYYDLLESHIKNTDNADSPLSFYFYNVRNENKIIALSEFTNCLSLMKKDEKIKSLQNKLVGTITESSIIEDEKTCLLNFLAQCISKSQVFDNSLFDNLYTSFENLFYSKQLDFIDSAYLHNFLFDNDSIDFGNGLSIKRDNSIIRNDEDYRFNNFSDRMRKRSKSNYFLERIYSRDKIVENPEDLPGNSKNNFDQKKIALSETNEIFDLVLDSIRILKPSSVFRDSAIVTKLVTFHPHGGTTIRSPLYDKFINGSKCRIDKDESETLKTIFNFLDGEKDNRFNVARRRLSLGIERTIIEDKLLDYMIGLEALYLPDGHTELTFKLSLRIAFLISQTDNNKEMFSFVKQMYDTRSKIVHGDKYSLSSDDVIKVEEILRKSLLLWINDKKKFSKTEYSNSGKTIKIKGYLDNIPFVD